MNIIYLIGAILIYAAHAEIADDSASNALNQFALKFLAETNNHLRNNENLVVSPYTIWTAMSIVNEGAWGNTAKELEQTLGIPPSGTEREYFRKLQQRIIDNVAQRYEGVTLEVLNSVFTRLEAILYKNFVELVQNTYKAKVQPLDFKNSTAAARYINKVISNATKGRISEIINAESVEDAAMFITSTLFFKGLWDKKFDKVDTRTMPFYNEHGEIIASVPMMRNIGAFAFSYILNGKAIAVELPYLGEKLSMIVVLPTRDSLSSVLHMISETPITTVINYLNRSKEMFGNSEIRVLLPRFKISSKLTLKDVLKNMGIHDAFSDNNADLSGISPKPLFVSRVIHASEIEVDEEGTVGSSVTVVEIQDKIMPPTFNAKKPFAFIIIDKQTKSIVFMGKVYNPNAV